MFYRRRVGVGKVLGAVFGAFIMGLMNNGMSIMGIGIDYQQVIKGLVLLATVWVDEYNHAYPVDTPSSHCVGLWCEGAWCPAG